MFVELLRSVGADHDDSEDAESNGDDAVILSANLRRLVVEQADETCDNVDQLRWESVRLVLASVENTAVLNIYVPPKVDFIIHE